MGLRQTFQKSVGKRTLPFAPLVVVRHPVRHPVPALKPIQKPPLRHSPPFQHVQNVRQLCPPRHLRRGLRKPPRKKVVLARQKQHGIVGHLAVPKLKTAAKKRAVKPPCRNTKPNRLQRVPRPPRPPQRRKRMPARVQVVRNAHPPVQPQNPAVVRKPVTGLPHELEKQDAQRQNPLLRRLMRKLQRQLIPKRKHLPLPPLPPPPRRRLRRVKKVKPRKPTLDRRLQPVLNKPPKHVQRAGRHHRVRDGLTLMQQKPTPPLPPMPPFPPLLRAHHRPVPPLNPNDLVLKAVGLRHPQRRHGPVQHRRHDKDGHIVRQPFPPPLRQTFPPTPQKSAGQPTHIVPAYKANSPP